jgi:putative intracellular protease/amidase
MKIVLVATSASKLKSHDTGLWIHELASPYYEFVEKGDYEITIASPAGGAVPIDAGSMAEGFFNDECKKFMHDPIAIGKLSHSVKLTDIDWEPVDAIFMTGGHGTCTDFVGQPSLKSAIETMYNSGKVVAAVCHGVLALADCELEDGTSLVKGKKVTGFSDSEEEAVQLSKIVPFLLETKLKELGSNYSKGSDWGAHVVTDGKLITGQNPQSADDVARAVIEMLS